MVNFQQENGIMCQHYLQDGLLNAQDIIAMHPHVNHTMPAITMDVHLVL